MMAVVRETGSLDLRSPEVDVILVAIVGRGEFRGASALTSSAPVIGLENLTDESTTTTDLPMGPRGTREALDVTPLDVVPLREIRAAPELLAGFADAFSSLRAVSSLLGLLV
jgi:hypothetical protein